MRRDDAFPTPSLSSPLSSAPSSSSVFVPSRGLSPFRAGIGTWIIPWYGWLAGTSALCAPDPMIDYRNLLFLLLGQDASPSNTLYQKSMIYHRTVTYKRS